MLRWDLGFSGDVECHCAPVAVRPTPSSLVEPLGFGVCKGKPDEKKPFANCPAQKCKTNAKQIRTPTSDLV